MGIFLYSFLVCCCLIPISFGEFQLVLIHTNDIHARIEQTDKYSSRCTEQAAADDKCFGGIARIWTKVQELRQQYPDNSLLLDAGDQFQGSLWSTHYKGREASHFMNIMGYDVMTIGNHDFEYGMQTLRSFIDNVTFPLVASNLDAGNTVLKGAYKPSHIFTIDQRKVGVVGFVISHMQVIQLRAKIEGLKFSDEIEAVRKEAIKLKSEGADIIIALGHSGHLMDKKVAKEVDQVDIVIGGHSHTFLYTGNPPSNEKPLADYPFVVEQKSGGKALVITEFAYSKYLGFLKVNFTDDGDVSSWEGQPILLNASVPQDTAMMATVEEWGKPLAAIKNEIIGESYVLLEGDSIGRDRVCRKRECSLGNVVTDAVLSSYVNGRPPTDSHWSDVAISVWNGGGMRINLNQGTITLEDVLTTLPFRNLIKGIKVTGNILLEMLENSVSGIGPPPSGRYLQMSGMKVKYNLEKPVGERVVSVIVQCTKCSVPTYAPLERTKNYTVLVNSFMVQGGDGYSMLTNLERLNIDTLASDALKEYIENFSPITTGLEGRIEYVTEDTTPATCDGRELNPLGILHVLSLVIYLCHVTI